MEPCATGRRQVAGYPRYEVVRELRRQLVSGALGAGQRLPTELALAERFRVSRGTVRSALAELAASGMIEQRRGVGSFVSEKVVVPAGGGKITLLYPASESINERIAMGMEQWAQEVGCELCFHSLTRDFERAAVLAAALRRAKSTGIVFSPFIQSDYYDVNSRLLDIFEEAELRYVVIDSPIACHGVIRGDFIGSDGYTAMRRAVKELVAAGFRRIASIRVFAGVYSSDQRFRGIFDQLVAEGFPLSPELHRVIEDVPLPEQGRGRIRELMMLPEPPDAVICTHDVIALNAMDELHRSGMRIPDDVALFGFDDQYYAVALGLSSVKQPLTEIGRRAVDILLEGSPVRRQEFLPCALMLRSSSSKKKDNAIQSKGAAL